jgi:hypothetical protein
MSKKTFKMTTGSLYKQRKISFTKTGIKLEEADNSENPAEAEDPPAPIDPLIAGAPKEPE